MVMWLERTKTAALLALTFIFFELMAILVVFSAPATAHEAPPATVDIRPIGPDRLAVGIDLDPRAFLAPKLSITMPIAPLRRPRS
jgi:hypothetical protein